MSIFNSRLKQNKNPYGAVKAGTEVSFRIKAMQYLSATLAMIKDGSKDYQLIPMNRFGDFFETSYCFSEAGLYFYLFILPDHSIVERGALGEGVVTTNRSHPTLYQQTVYAASYEAAEGFAGSTMYQVFPDRFNVGSCGVLDSPFKERVFHENFSELPTYLPNEAGDITNFDFFGGNFRGIEEKLDYLIKIGISCVYMNPIGEAHSNHRYDTAHYKKPDPLLGTEKDFKALCKAAHKRGIKIVLDGVFSHTGVDSIYFNKYGTYDSVGAYQSQQSEYSGWFKFNRFPDDYVSWWGFDTLPEVNELDEHFVRYVCGKNGVLDYWIKLGADGFRLDVADELPDKFIEKLREGIKRNGKDKILIGEVWEDASNKISYGSRRQFLWGKSLDSVMNYPFRTAILDFAREANAQVFMDRVDSICENYPKPMLDQMMNMISTHDTARALNTLICGDEHKSQTRLWQAERTLSAEEYYRAVELLKLCMVLQFTLPGVPCVYYGDEIGMQGFGDPFCRGFMRWDAVDNNILAALEEISLFRKKNKEILAHGEFVPIKSDNNTVAYLRSDKTFGDIFVAVNRSDELVSVSTPDGKTVVIAAWGYVFKKL